MCGSPSYDPAYVHMLLGIRSTFEGCDQSESTSFGQSRDLSLRAFIYYVMFFKYYTTLSRSKSNLHFPGCAREIKDWGAIIGGTKIVIKISIGLEIK
jgi:hypothetical protein